MTNTSGRDIMKTSIVKKVFRGRPATIMIFENWYRRPKTVVSEHWTSTYYADGGANHIGNDCIEELERLIIQEIERTRND